ncbi:MFS transporter [Xylanibacillus composti]|uniref:MFS transporter n=1 Tax=Xylanibacillus composti TaxID=1572762 RepID=A0A8J4H2V4_9BACL|nr:MFS transporter [Xylanibacillus composti]MDT9723477.1 MFS transporter [Xylanibacillus composti]GIQ68486.1 MFS transporter [Xylanibacillus composti]
MNTTPSPAPAASQAGEARTATAARPFVFKILIAISLIHLLNDTMQSVIPAVSLILEETMSLTYTQVGLIAFTLNLTAALLQPVIGLYSDARPTPFLLPLGMVFSLLGMLGLSMAPSYAWVIVSVMLVGIGSAVFHPEAARVAFLAAGPRRGLAQSIYQVGGNAGQSLAPILAILIFVPFGQFGAIWFTFAAALAIVFQLMIARWYRNAMQETAVPTKSKKRRAHADAYKGRIRLALLLVILFIFARSWYHAGISSFYPFYLIEKYGMSIERTQVFIFLFAAAGVVGTFIGGPLADWFGRKKVLIASMLGAAPLTVLLPFATPFWSYVLLTLIGLILLSSFSVMVVYAQELIPGKVATASGLTIGLAFGLGAAGSFVWGKLADIIGLENVMLWASWLPLVGLIAFLLPSDAKISEWTKEETA